MEIKRIDPKLYKAIMMAFSYQINCELTPGQCKELVDFIDNTQQVEDKCVWKIKTSLVKWGDKTLHDIKKQCDPESFYTAVIEKDIEKNCMCGKRIRYEDVE